MNSGADDYLTKPVDIPDLLAAVHARLERQQVLEATLASGPDFTSSKPLEAKLGLTPREAEVLLWVAQGKSNGDIALILSTSESTIKKHLEHIFEKLSVENRGAAALTAVEALSGRK
jgi:DNA-binding NarL/FixJ family response regulator